MEMQEINKELILKTDFKYDLFKIKKGLEDDLLILYKKLELYLRVFARSGITAIDDKYDFKYSKLIFLVSKLIKEVEVFEYLKGVDKKQMVINILILMIERELPIPGIAKFLLVSMVELIVPVMIDEMIELTKNMKHSSLLKKIRRKFLRIFTCGVYKKR